MNFIRWRQLATVFSSSHSNLQQLHSIPHSVFILGRFPPPIDGQSMLTEQTARLLEDTWKVHRINTALQGETYVRTSSRWNLSLVSHYLNLINHTRRALALAPDAPVIWNSISPKPLGHFRDLFSIVSAFRPHQKVYAVVHWGNFDLLFRSPLTRFTARRLVRRLTGFVFNSDNLNENCAAWIPAEKRFIILNTIDSASRCTHAEVVQKQALRIQRKSLRLLFLSNMIPAKGYFDVLGAVQLLHAAGIPVFADFIGRWQSDKDCTVFKNYVTEYNLNNVVQAHGGLNNRAAIKQFYLDADVFLLPTYYPTEAQPVSILEAINAGTPVVTTRHASIPHMVREHAKEALFVPPRSPEAIAVALRTLLDTTTWLSYSKAAEMRFMTHFSPEAVRQQWEALLARP
ncbi:glycosyltransferase family 4 protein [Synechococcus sp. Tobar12-5m-g]|uniref:glycosyltransferase family 4 protein n=1 Tax=unclassified Synechococcus TaxID=2626047 RepID=UPI0020CCD2CB|nr:MULTISPECIES: glycosyltransferase family 4 protein [unclassified Synechococcus]MCP9773852.1 glycosyltransferase family 4 protein [Synechococcus sp. Tobar12-5m-g]MCP9874983.1 glycosyltransferase family 4 protein [Synechococcus sp. Cruz CV-v-12]